MFLHQVKVELVGTGRTIFRGLYLFKPNAHLKAFLFQIKTWTCDQLVQRSGDSGHQAMLGYGEIKGQGY